MKKKVYVPPKVTKLSSEDLSPEARRLLDGLVSDLGKKFDKHSNVQFRDVTQPRDRTKL